MRIVDTRFQVVLLLWVFFYSPITLAIDSNISSANNDTHEILEEDIDLILQVQVNRLNLGDVFGVKKNGAIYLGMQNLFEVLGFLIDVDQSNKSASGWFIKKSFDFRMEEPDDDADIVDITSQGSAYEVAASKFIYEDDDIYINAKKIFEIIKIEYLVNLNNLTLKIFPSQPLPIQEKLARQKRAQPNSRNLGAALPLKRTAYRLLSIPFIDTQTRYTTNNTNSTTLSYSMLGSGDLAYMTSSYYLQGDKEDNLKYFRMKLSRGSLKNNLFGPLKATYFSVGDINPNAGGGVGRSGSEVGLKITNLPLGQVLKIQKKDFYGDAQPGWDVELYRNNIYLGVQTVGENGRYEFFNQNVLAGKNEFKLVFHGPQGQRYEKNENVNLSSGGLDVDKLHYDISLSRQNSRLFEFRDNYSRAARETRRFNITLLKNFTNNISFLGTYSRYTFIDGSTHNYFKPVARIYFLDTLLTFNATIDFNGGASSFYSLSKSFWGQSFSYTNTSSSPDFKIESTDVQQYSRATQSADLSGQFIGTSFLRLNYGLSASRTELKEVSFTDAYSANFAVSLWRLSLNNNLNYTKHTLLGMPPTQNVSGIAGMGTTMLGVRMRGNVSYLLDPISDITIENVKNIRPKQITKLSAALSWKILPKLRSQYKYSYLPSNKLSTHGVSFSWQTKKFSLTSNITSRGNDNYAAYVGVNFSLGYDHKTSKLKIGAERISRTGGISAQIYRDDNFNGRLDANELVIKGAKISAEQARKEGKSDNDGKVFFPGLPVYQPTDVELDIASLEDPFLISSTAGYSFIPRPGVVENINVPLVTSGEIEGTVYIENENGSSQTGGGVPLILTNTKTREVKSVTSAYDGFYLFSGIKPGKYLVSVDPLYLKRIQFSAKKPMPRVVDIYASGNVDMGNDFSIYASSD